MLRVAFALSAARPVVAGSIPTATALPAPGPANASSAPGIVFAVCSYTVAMLSWRRGDGHTGTGGIRGTRFHWEGLKTKSEKSRKQKALGRSRG